MTPSELSKWFTISLADGAELRSAVQELAGQLRAPTLLHGAGEVSDAAVATLGERGRRERALAGSWDLVSLQGHALPNGESTLSVLLSRDAESGPMLVGGQLIRATVRHVVITAATAMAPGGEAPAPRSSEPTRRASEGQGEAGHASPAPGPAVAHVPLPRRPTQRIEEPEQYPEDNDLVDHFAFGECVVLESDGERLRLQAKDGRVREVALSMLRIGGSELGEDGRRRWQLQRKN